MNATESVKSANVLIKHDMTPPEGARPTGELHLGVYPVYVRTVERSRCVPVLDEKGEPLFHRHPGTGVVTGKPVTRLETWEEEEEFVLVPVGNGQTTINRNFRPSKDEALRQAQAVERTPDKLAERLERMERFIASLGVSPEEIDGTDAEDSADAPKGKK